MKITAFFLITCMALGFMVASCDTDIEARKLMPDPTEYSEEYYANLRAWKETDHPISYVWFADYNQSSSLGYRFAGLPDSLDIVSLWGGYPEPGTIAYEEMWEMRNKKGTRLVAPTIIRLLDFYEELGLTSDDIDDINNNNPAYTMDPDFPDWAVLFGNYLLEPMWEAGIDGLDLDYEPESSSEPIRGENLAVLVKYIGQFIGPMSPNPDKLLIVDFYTSTPHQDCEPYVNYFVRQAYSQGFTEHSVTRLQTYYNSLSSWCPTEKFIVTESLGVWWQTGGSPFLDEFGEYMYLEDGTQVYSLEGMALWNPTQGQKGGFGAFYVQRDYNTSAGGSNNEKPYGHTRRAIQLQNPAITQ